MKVLPLYDRDGNFLDWALVDDDVFERAEQYTWRRESYERKNSEPREYAFARIDGVRTRLHHLVMNLPTVDEDVIDHRNHDGRCDSDYILYEGIAVHNLINGC